MASSAELTRKMREARKLFRRAQAGDVAAVNQMMAANDQLVKIVNSRLRQLERKGFDYGGAYNNLIHYTQTEYDGKRLVKSAKLENDIYAVYDQILQANKFLSMKSGSVEGQEEILNNKISVLKNMGIFSKDYAFSTMKRFVKFLGNEETREIVEEYGNSLINLAMIKDAFFSRRNTTAALKRAFAEYLAQTNGSAKTFDELMARLGVDVYNEKYYGQQHAKNNFERG